ncbi:MAG TPA: LacI family DNA-binding transcriptional regulator [Enteractinococcus sp.]
MPTHPKSDRVRLKDVADATGLAPSTVSRAFTNPDRVNFQTVEKIMRVAHQMGYRRQPTLTASEDALTRTINIIVQDSSNQFYMGFMHGILQRARLAGYLTIVADTGEDLLMERAYIRRLNRAVDGIIAAAPTTPASELRELARTAPLVLFNREISGVNSVVAFTPDDVSALVDHLHQYGHTRIVWCAGPKFAWSNKIRTDRLVQRCAELGIELIVTGPFIPTVHQGWQAASKAIAYEPTAIMGFNDQLAVGAIQYLLAHGYRVPEDISVTGFDNTQSASIIHTGLTCLRAPLTLAGHRAVEMLFGLLEGDTGAQAIRLEAELVIRGSTGPARQHSLPSP